MQNPEELLEQIVLNEQNKMKQQLGFIELFLPNKDATAKCNVFVSPNYQTCARLMLFVVSGRGIQPGIWSRSLVVESYQQHISAPYHNGSMFPYLYTALENGYGVIVMNPNTNNVYVEGNKVPILYSDTPETHVQSIWKMYGLQSNCAQVYVVAYGRGGDLVKHLVMSQPSIQSKLAAVAFIESSHRITDADAEEIRNLIGTRAINWKRSTDPPGTQLPDCAQLGCLSLSAGCPDGDHSSSNTAWTIAASMPTVFAFFESAQNSLPMQVQQNEDANCFNSVEDNAMVIEEHEDNMGARGKSMVISKEMGVQDFELLSVIGKGAYGKVFLAKKNAGRNKNRVYAMKVLKKSDVFKKKQVEHTKSEQRILKHVEHPFVVRLRYAFQNEHKLYLVMDYYPGGSLFVHLRKSKAFEEPKARFYAAQLFLAIAHLHSLHVMYRDLKLENILMDSMGNIAITDFGLSKEDDQGSTFVGTPEYLAPELLSSQRTSTSYGKSVDWWSYGVLVYELISGKTPFWDKNRRQMFQNILTGEPFYSDESFSPDAQSFLKGLLVKNPNQRLGCGEHGSPQQIMEHPWFNGIDWNAMLAKQLETPYRPTVGNSTDTRYVPQVFKQQQVADSPVVHSLGYSGPGRQTMHFDDFSYMGSDVMSSRRTSIFRDSEMEMDLEAMSSAGTSMNHQ